MFLRPVVHGRQLDPMHFLTGNVCKKAHLGSQHIAVGTRHEQAQLHTLAGFTILIDQVERHAVFSVVVQRVNRIFHGIGAVFVLDFAAKRRTLGRDRCELFLGKTRTVIILERHRGFLVFGGAFQANTVLSRRETETHRTALLLVHFGDQLTLIVADKEAPFDIVVEFQAGARAAQIRHHHITRSREVHVAARMLRAAHRRFGFLQGFVESELIGFGQGHLAVSTDVTGTAEATYKRMSKEGALQFVTLLARFILRAARDKGVAFHVAALVDHERRDSDTALHSRDGARAARIDHRNLHVGIQRIDTLAEFLPGIDFFTKAKPLFVGVTAIIHQHFFAEIFNRTVTGFSSLCRFRGDKLFVKRIKLLLEALYTRLRDTVHILLRHAAHLRKHFRKGARIRFGITQTRAFLTAVIRAHRKHVAFNRNRARRHARRMRKTRRRKDRHQKEGTNRDATHAKIATQNFSDKLFHRSPPYFSTLRNVNETDSTPLLFRVLSISFPSNSNISPDVSKKNFSNLGALSNL